MISIIILVTIVIFIIGSYFVFGGNMSNYFIEANHLYITRFYFRFVLFLFGVLTFLFGVHDTLIETREHNNCYHVDIPPFLHIDHLVEEDIFSKKGCFDPGHIKLHSDTNVDYLIVLDRTGSVDNVISNYLSNYFELTFAKDYKHSQKIFDRLDGPDLVLAGIIHQLSFISDIERIRLNVQVYNGDAKFEPLLDAKWISLPKGVGQEEATTKSFLKILNRLADLKPPQGSQKTYFNEIYNKLSADIDKKYGVTNPNIILLSDFVHEFDEHDNSQNELEEEIYALRDKLVDCKKISLVELPTKSSIESLPYTYSIEGVNLLKKNVPQAKLYAWSYNNLNTLSYKKLTAFFNSIVSVPTDTIVNFSYNKRKIGQNDFLQFLNCDYFAFEVVNEANSKSVLSRFPTIKIGNEDEVKIELMSNHTNKALKVNLIYDLQGYTSKEGTIKFIPLNPLPSRSIGIFFLTYILLFSTILFTLIVYYFYSYKYTGDATSTTQRNEELKKFIRGFIIVISVLLIILFFLLLNPESIMTILRSKRNLFWLTIGSLCALNIAPFMFYRFEKT